MAIVAAKLKEMIKTRIYNSLKKNFAADGKNNKAADASWKKQAEAIAEIAEDICLFLQTDVQVAPGIPTAGSPAAHVTTAPGKLI